MVQNLAPAFAVSSPLPDVAREHTANYPGDFPASAGDVAEVVGSPFEQSDRTLQFAQPELQVLVHSIEIDLHRHALLRGCNLVVHPWSAGQAAELGS